MTLPPCIACGGEQRYDDGAWVCRACDRLGGHCTCKKQENVGKTVTE